jgi:hypothetical protein
MGLFDRFKKKPPKTAEPQERPAKVSKRSPKDIATEKGEPYVSILGMEVDPDNLHQGSFELDWNSIFVTRLIRAGYMMKEDDTDADIVDRWFQNVCRHVVMETFEQEQAMNPQPRFTQRRDIGGGRSEIS